ncbi:long-chain acyl-CoA synthetase [Antricoccus suffuscus]|uniref:Long-chain acyl-CoA synthetase n=1 Tax=Antricoccus suffuscus TaxID=1629062 RepID=A0A2T0ZRT5_9ACTN|nr:AMP-binding protein [Antricoccus suffuscus]PRZ39071.1 long-chain acyl-CoA synthetase [Antricoccus suffuscus]
MTDDPTDVSDVRTQADLVTRAAVSAPGRTAYIDRDGSMTWTLFDAGVGRVAAALQALGAARGDRVVIAVPTTIPFALAYFAASRAGLVAVPANPGFSRRELGHVVADSTAAVVVGALDADGLSAMRDLSGTVSGYLTADDVRRIALDEHAPSISQVPVESDDLATMVYTSGTTGTPRGAMLTHRNLMANREQLGRIQPPPLNAKDVLYVGVPAFHIYGLGSGLCQVAWVGATGVLVDDFHPVPSLDVIAERGVTNILAVPQMYAAWAACDPALLASAFANVRIASSGAAPLDADVIETLREVAGLTIWEGYGLTETSPVVTSTLVGGLPKPGSIGRALPGVEIELRDLEDGSIIDNADPESDHDSGEIVVRGANVFVGYWPDSADGPDAEGWFATGDIAYADDDGDLFLVDRAKELILVSGFNVYPKEVEQVVASLDGVREVAAVGVPHAATGEAVKVFIVREPSEAGSALDEAAVLDRSERDLARFKRPTVVEFIDALPHTSTGKVRRNALRASEAGKL